MVSNVKWQKYKNNTQIIINQCYILRYKKICWDWIKYVKYVNFKLLWIWTLSVRATKTMTHFLCQSVYSGCVLFAMKWSEHIINSQRKVTWSQRSIDRADSDVKWLNMQRAPSGPRGRRDNLVSHSHHLVWHTCSRHAAHAGRQESLQWFIH